MKNNKFSPSQVQHRLDDKFYNACATGNMDIIHQLCKQYPPHKTHSNPLVSSFMELPKKLSPRVDLHSGGNRHLLIACKKGHKEVVHFLLSKPSFIEKINRTDYLATGLFFAIEYGHNEIADIILPLISRKNENYLYQAKRTFIQLCDKGDLQPIKYLLNNKNLEIDPNDLLYCVTSTTDSLYGGEGFKIACKNGHLDVVKYLTSSTELSVHIDLKKIQTVVEVKDINIMRHFIFDLKIKKHDGFMFRVNFADDSAIDYLYKELEVQEMHEQLTSKVPNKTSPTSAPKKIKI